MGCNIVRFEPRPGIDSGFGLGAYAGFFPPFLPSDRSLLYAKGEIRMAFL